ncbi:MAG: peptide ABC transporter substrate-binding protein, partial [Chloroflexi bacterium]|nr:peptide ABC transporter substrate-binding protein [Chloroflexota bacterium]
DQNARIQLYQQAEQIIVNDAAWLPLWHTKTYILVKPYIKGYAPAPLVIPILQDVSIQR